MTAHRYWRVLINWNSFGSNASGVELGFCTAVNGASVATGGTPAASTSNGSYPVSNLFDGNTATLWNSSGGVAGEWVSYDFGSGNNQDIVEVYWTARTDGTYWTLSPTDLAVQYSDDNSTWTTGWYGIHDGWTTGQTVRFTKQTASAFTAHSYWGIVCKTGGNVNFAVSTMRTRSTIDGPNTATGGTPRASSVYGGTTYPASNAFDSDPTTFWADDSTDGVHSGVCLTYAQGSSTTCAQVDLTCRPDNTWCTQTPATFDVIYSDDGKSWGIEWSASAATWTNGATQTFTNPSATSVTAPTLDGSATAVWSGSSGTVTLTTTNGNDAIVVLIGFESYGTGVQRTVSSVTASGLTFTQRMQKLTASGDSVYFQSMECWWAPASAALSSKVITVTLSGSTDNTAVIAFGVNGAYDYTNPWDSNGGLPVANNGNVAAVPTFSTNQNSDFIFTVGGIARNVGYTSNWRTIGNAHSSGGAQWEFMDAFYERVSSAQSSVNSSITTAGGNYDTKYVDAITANNNSNNPFIPNHHPKGKKKPKSNVTNIRLRQQKDYQSVNLNLFGKLPVPSADVPWTNDISGSGTAKGAGGAHESFSASGSAVQATVENNAAGYRSIVATIVIKGTG